MRPAPSISTPPACRGSKARSYDRLAVDFAYSHIFINNYSMNEREVFTSQTIDAITGEDNDDANTLSGHYKADADIFSLGIRWKFGKD